MGTYDFRNATPEQADAMSRELGQRQPAEIVQFSEYDAIRASIDAIYAILKKHTDNGRADILGAITKGYCQHCGRNITIDACPCESDE